MAFAPLSPTAAAISIGRVEIRHSSIMCHRGVEALFLPERIDYVRCIANQSRIESRGGRTSDFSIKVTARAQE